MALAPRFRWNPITKQLDLVSLPASLDLGFSLDYSEIAGGYDGNVEFEAQGAEDDEFTTGVVTLDTGTSKTDWKACDGIMWMDMPDDGFPTHWEQARYVGAALDGLTYLRWRSYYDPGTGNIYSDWVMSKEA